MGPIGAQLEGSGSSMAALRTKYRMGFRKVYIQGIILRTLSVQREVDERHVDALVESYRASEGVLQRGSVFLQAVCYAKIDSNLEELREGALGFLVGQHRTLALQKAVMKDLVKPQEAWFNVELYDPGA